MATMMEERIEEVFETGPQADVSVENVRGSITVEGWDEPRVRLEARRRGERARIVYQHEGNRVEVRTEIEPRERSLWGWTGRDNQTEVSYHLQVPAASQVRIRNVSGPIHVSGIQGTVEAKSVDGQIQLANVAGDVRAEATNGALELTTISGRAQAFTTNGSIVLRDSQLEMVTAETINGSIRLDPLSAGSDVRTRTVNGELFLHVPDGVQANLEASGVMLHTHIGIDHQSQSTGRTAWRGSVGHGQSGAQVSYSTVNGRLTVSGAGGQTPTDSPAPMAWTAAEAPPTPTPAPAAPQDTMSILAAVDRGEITVERALALMKGQA